MSDVIVEAPKNKKAGIARTLIQLLFNGASPIAIKILMKAAFPVLNVWGVSALFDHVVDWACEEFANGLSQKATGIIIRHDGEVRKDKLDAGIEKAKAKLPPEELEKLYADVDNFIHKYRD